MLDTDTKAPENQFLLTSAQTQKSQILNFADNNIRTIVYFFAPWCQICHLSMPNLVEIQASKGEQIKIVAIALDYQKQSDVNDFIEQHALNFPVYYGQSAIQKAFKVSAFPSYYLIDKNGVVTHKVVGYTSEIGMRLRL